MLYNCSNPLAIEVIEKYANESYYHGFYYGLAAGIALMWCCCIK